MRYSILDITNREKQHFKVSDYISLEIVILLHEIKEKEKKTNHA
ncbi:hypothetical protein [Bacillus toyonensis]|nr:hypothetical protein [Bacillus toyonensis]